MSDVPLSTILGLVSDEEGYPGSAGRAHAVQEWLARVVREVPGLRAFHVAPGMLRELARALSDPVSEIAANLWNKREEIRKYADPVRYPATETHEVELYQHELKQTVKPTIEVRVNGGTIGTVVLTVTAGITLKAAKLVIRGGYITHVRLGDLVAKAVLGVEQPAVLEKLKVKELKSDTWKLDKELRFPGNGIRIPTGP